MFKIRIISFMVVLMFLSSCKDEINSNIPTVSFNVTINLTRPEYAALLGDGQSITLPTYDNYGRRAGYAGLVIIKSSFSNSGFYAFDRCCTHNPNEAHQVNADGALAVCPVDSSVFVLIDGSGIPSTGPATLPLRRYNVSVSGNELSVYQYAN
ncbi:Rieske (2Fe-2S) protein [Saccharicrinis sp. FJH2]|uniref:Rieske (2Fe-2S) protein n=1 Tax=unclassified Saccharicrinis TaxID=2646859 RepID=UPI0035D4EA79